MNRRADDATLVAAAQSGEREAMDELLRRHYPRIHAVCSRIAGSTRDADDAAQEAMIRIVRSIDRFDGRSAFGTWAYRIATNAALDELRRRNRRPVLRAVEDDELRRRSRRPVLRAVEDDDDDRPHETADPIAHRTVDAVADRLAIDAALAEVPEDFRIPVIMRDVGDLDYAEIADELGVPIGTVKSRIARGRRMLIEHLGNHDDHSGRPTRATPRTGDSAPPPNEQ